MSVYILTKLYFTFSQSYINLSDQCKCTNINENRFHFSIDISYIKIYFHRVLVTDLYLRE